ncbi:hypothetical protein SAMN05216251_10885 [Actinacidiphila alni]|uniref:HEAT repeat domain-containing protein n=1 Tax=Actinacidiphila alni TaxID=380248 RepID=A0A1I2FW36_9ACTN|nr:hypothetical protein [Actinacidiphila alni]SFF09019.1 hypothetical protein SAMN05216251_10885 [Actinacidiphila alni]
MSRSVNRLLAELKPLPYGNRLARTAKRAREWAESGELEAVVGELDAGTPYERHVAALAALVGRHTDYLAEHLADADPVVSGYALRALRLLPIPDAAVEAAYDDAPSHTRRRLTRAVVAAHRTALAERLVVRLRAEWGEAEAAKLLPVCSAEFVARLVPEVAHAVESWGRVARRHPDAVLDHAARELAAQPLHLRTQWWQRHAHAVAVTARTRPERVLTLLERYGPGELPAPLRDRLGALVAADADRTVRWLVSPDRDRPRYEPLLPRSVLRALVRADRPSLVDLGRHALARPAHLAALLKAMPPSRRAGFLDAARAGADPRGDVVLAVLPLLPRERRWAEVRRWVPRGRTEEWLWWEVLETLAEGRYEEAWPVLTAELGRPDAEERALVWPILVTAVRRSGERAAVAELLTLMLRLRNERDPVRAAALGALADLPPRLFAADDVASLDRIVRDALEARDSSAATRAAVRRLAVAVLAANAAGTTSRDGDAALLAWALRAVERIAGHIAVADLGPLGRTLRRGQEHQVFDALYPWLRAACDKADHRLLLALTGALGRRARHMPALQALLAEALEYGDDNAFRAAAGLWLDAPATRGERVERILALEPSAAVLPEVRRVLTRHRTDLLDVLIGRKPPYGRFLTPGKRRPLPPLDDVRRWLPHQQETVFAMAERAAADESQPVLARAAAVRLAVHVPVRGLGFGLRWAALDTGTGSAHAVPLAEAALGALPYTDRPQDTLPVLLAHAGDDRARVAVYAAGRAARFAAPSELAGLLAELLDGTRAAKVTGRKEAVRLAAGLLPLREAAALLAAAYRRPGQHPDVQAAVVAFAAGLLARGATGPAAHDLWSLLAEAVHGAPQSRTALLRTTPWSLPAPHRPHYARLVADIAATPTDADDAEPKGPEMPGAAPEAAQDGVGSDAVRSAVRAAVRELPRWVAYAPEAVGVLSRAVTDPRVRATWAEAAQAVARLATSGLPHPVGGAAPGSLLHGTVTELIVAVGRGEYDAEADRDLPARRRLVQLVHHLPRPQRSADPARDTVRPVLTALAALLAAEPSLAEPRVWLLCRLADPEAGPGLSPDAGGRLLALADALAGRPALAVRTAAQLRSDLMSGRTPERPDLLLDAARRCAADGGTAAGLLAVAVLDGVGVRLRWPEPWRAALRAARRHPDSDVRDAALEVTVAHE